MGARTGLAGILTAVVVLTACGAEDADPESAREPGASTSGASSPTSPSETPTSSPSETPTPEPGADAPACGDVWRDGARLPRAYKGCNETPGDASTYVKRDVLDCSSGQRMVRYADHFYGVLGGTVHRTESRLSKDRGYGDAVARCRG